MSGKTTIPDEVKRYIVVALACYDSPSAVAEAVREEFKIDLPRQSIQNYDPTKYAGRNLAKQWREMFHAEREAFKKATSDIPIAQRAFRLRALHRMADKAEKMRNLPLAAQLMEQAAKEVGDVFTNRQKVDLTVPAYEDALKALAKGGQAAKPAP